MCDRKTSRTEAFCLSLTPALLPGNFSLVALLLFTTSQKQKCYTTVPLARTLCAAVSHVGEAGRWHVAVDTTEPSLLSLLCALTLRLLRLPKYLPLTSLLQELCPPHLLYSRSPEQKENTGTQKEISRQNQNRNAVGFHHVFLNTPTQWRLPALAFTSPLNGQNTVGSSSE